MGSGPDFERSSRSRKQIAIFMRLFARPSDVRFRSFVWGQYKLNGYFGARAKSPGGLVPSGLPKRPDQFGRDYFERGFFGSSLAASSAIARKSTCSAMA